MYKEDRKLYALPCTIKKSSSKLPYDDFFFITFKTTNLEEALRLASCVCGVEKAKKTLFDVSSIF